MMVVIMFLMFFSPGFAAHVGGFQLDLISSQQGRPCCMQKKTVKKRTMHSVEPEAIEGLFFAKLETYPGLRGQYDALVAAIENHKTHMGAGVYEYVQLQTEFDQHAKRQEELTKKKGGGCAAKDGAEIPESLEREYSLRLQRSESFLLRSLKKQQDLLCQKNAIDRGIMSELFEECEDYDPGRAVALGEHFAEMWENTLDLNSKILLGGFLQGFFGVMDARCRAEACSLGKVIFRGCGAVIHVLYLRFNVITIALSCFTSLMRSEKYTKSLSDDVYCCASELFERLGDGDLWVEKDTQDPALLNVVAFGVRQAQVCMEICRPYLSIASFFVDDDAWIPAGVSVRNIVGAPIEVRQKKDEKDPYDVSNLKESRNDQEDVS